MRQLAPCSDPPFADLVNESSYDSRPLLDILPPPDDPWSISPELAIMLFRLVTEHRLAHVLEFGAGFSSIVLARALSAIGGGQLTSLDQDPAWCARKWKIVQDEVTVDAELNAAQPRLAFGVAGFANAYSSSAPQIAERGPYDLLLIDAPQYYYGRDGALHTSHSHLAAGAIIVLDDAGRSAEQWSIRRWLRSYPGLELRLYDPHLAGKGVAVLQVMEPLTPRFDAVTLLSSAYHAVEHWTKRRRRQKRKAHDTSTDN